MFRIRPSSVSSSNARTVKTVSSTRGVGRWDLVERLVVDDAAELLPETGGVTRIPDCNIAVGGGGANIWDGGG